MDDLRWGPCRGCGVSVKTEDQLCLTCRFPPESNGKAVDPNTYGRLCAACKGTGLEQKEAQS